MHSPGAEPALRNLESSTLAQNHGRRRYAHFVKRHFSVSMRWVEVAHDAYRPLDPDTTSVWLNEYLRLLKVRRSFWVGLSHHDPHAATRVHHAARKPLPSRYDIGV